MRKPTGAIESTLRKNPNAMPPVRGMQPYGGQNAQPYGGQGAQQSMQQDGAPADFQQIVMELQQLIMEGKLPADFDLQAACTDPAFAALIAEFPAEAALRIYVAESKATSAEENAMQRVSTQMRARTALPRSARGGAMSAPAPNYRDMDSATFRKLLGELKKTARSGGQTRL